MSGFRRRDTSAVAETKEEVKPANKPTASKGGNKTYHNNAFSILEGKDGSFYLALDKKNPVEIFIDGKLVTGMISKDPMVELEESVAAGRITEGKAGEIASKIPEFVKSRVTLVTE